MCRPFDACSPQCPAQTWDLNWGQSQCRRRQWISGGYNGGCSIAIIERWIQPRSIYSIHERKCRGWPRILEDLIRREERPMTCSSNLNAWDWVLCKKNGDCRAPENHNHKDSSETWNCTAPTTATRLPPTTSPDTTVISRHPDTRILDVF